ncbi:MAG: hypothetical protein ACK4M6_16010, partial [Hyphomonas sp.]
VKLARGGQVDAEFVAQVRQLRQARAGGPLTVSTLEALADDPALAEAWRLQQALSQILGAAFDDRPDPEHEPEGFRLRLARAANEIARLDALFEWVEYDPAEQERDREAGHELTRRWVRERALRLAEDLAAGRPLPPEYADLGPRAVDDEGPGVSG